MSAYLSVHTQICSVLGQFSCKAAMLLELDIHMQSRVLIVRTRQVYLRLWWFLNDTALAGEGLPVWLYQSEDKR